jgi:hypothetical protein
MTKEVVTTVTVAQYTIGMSITYGPGPHMPMTEPMGNTGLSNFAMAGEKIIQEELYLSGACQPLEMAHEISKLPKQKN